MGLVVERYNGEYEFTEEDVRAVKHNYPLDTCTCHKNSPCLAHEHLIVAVRKEQAKHKACINSLTIDDLLTLIKERDG